MQLIAEWGAKSCSERGDIIFVLSERIKEL